VAVEIEHVEVSVAVLEVVPPGRIDLAPTDARVRTEISPIRS